MLAKVLATVFVVMVGVSLYGGTAWITLPSTPVNWRDAVSHIIAWMTLVGLILVTHYRLIKKIWHK